MNPQETGKRIQELRKKHGWTQKELAERLYVTDRAVSKWERGLNYPDMSLLEPMAQVLSTTVAELLGIENAPEKEKMEAVTAVAVEETARMRKELRDRALIILLNGVILLVSQFLMYTILFYRQIDEPSIRILSIGMISLSGTLIGNALWIWWKNRKP